jgi:hypothetical protein
MGGGREPEGGWWQDEKGKWRQGGRRTASGPARKSFLFGDARRPRSLGLALVASVATFPVFWAICFFLMFLGESGSPHAERVIVVVAGTGSAIALMAATVAWLAALRTYPPDEHGALRSREGALSAAGLLIALGAAVALGVVLWNTYI